MTNSTFESIIKISTKGMGYVNNPETKEDVVIDTSFLNKALDGDRVRVQLQAHTPGADQKGEVTHVVSRSREQFVGTVIKDKDQCIVKPDNFRIHVEFVLTSDDINLVESDQKGEVTHVVSRSREQFVGTVIKDKDQCIVKPDNFRIHVEFVLTSDDINLVESDQKVLVKLTEWEDEKLSPKAKLIKIFGHKGEHEVEIQSIVYEKGFVTEYPKEADNEAQEIGKKWKTIPQEEIDRRLDLRSKNIMTIDPFDAKDFDDAMHIVPLENGNFEVGVHIADVSHFVTPGSKLDAEAFDRSFSVYLVDRTIPMLPEILSNGLCSLNPNEDTLAFSAMFEITPDGEVVSRYFKKSIIHSKKRFTYEEAQAVLDADTGPFVEDLRALNKLAKVFTKKNREAGSIEFATDEIKFELDEVGHPIRIVKKERLDTHKLVEEYMLLANREVAKFIYDFNKENGKMGLMYRNHDIPNAEKLKQLTLLLKSMNYYLPLNEEGSVTARDLNKLFSEVDGKAEESLIKTAAIRTMSKALYGTESLGHFGLSFEFYTHFTSPIRRYPDLLVHRILQKFINGEKITDQEQTHFNESAVRASEREIAAAEAERESIKYKQAEYMNDHIGEIYDGVISGVTGWGVYVVITETLSEGLVHISKLGNDYFKLDEKGYSVVGEKTGAKISLGDKVKVKIEKIDLERKNIDLSIVK